MGENNVIENESANNLEVAEQEETVESTVEVENADTKVENEQTVEENTVQTEVQTKSEVEVQQEEPKKVQTKEEQQIARLARLEAEKKAEAKFEKIRKEAFEQGKKIGKVETVIGKVNPYTNEIIKDDYDAQEYLDMYELEVQGKDPIKDYRAIQKEKARAEAEKQIQMTKEQEKQEWYRKDTKDFVDKYSIEELKKISNDKDFGDFAEGKIGNMPLADIYEKYNKFINKYEKKSVQTAKQIVANNDTTPGRLNEGEPKVLDWDSMSDEQFEKYLQKAKDGELR